MDLTPEQKDLVRAWAAQGDSISDIQTRLASECGVHLSYMDTRFLLIDLSVSVAEKNAKKDEPPPAPEPEPEGYGAAPPPPGADAEAELPPGADEEDAGLPGEGPEDAAPPAAGAVQVELARIQRPGFAASGSLTCSDGVKGEWGIDAYGRLALAFPDDKGYRPSAADQQAFMEKLRSLLSAGY
ncbi:MAG: hypothetical protein IJV65_09750 [Kiritimatiellae bacterium]|nr:hypothetical protein [Kiritimatiellia bacterium]